LLASDEVSDRRRPIGELLKEALPGRWIDVLRNPVHNRLRRHYDRNHCGDLDRLVRTDAERAVLIALAVGMKVGDVENARRKHNRNTKNSQDRYQ